MQTTSHPKTKEHVVVFSRHARVPVPSPDRYFKPYWERKDILHRGRSGAVFSFRTGQTYEVVKMLWPASDFEVCIFKGAPNYANGHLLSDIVRWEQPIPGNSRSRSSGRRNDTHDYRGFLIKMHNQIHGILE